MHGQYLAYCCWKNFTAWQRPKHAEHRGTADQTAPTKHSNIVFTITA